MKSLKVEGKERVVVVGFFFLFFFPQLGSYWKETGPVGDQIYEGHPHVLT